MCACTEPPLKFSKPDFPIVVLSERLFDRTKMVRKAVDLKPTVVDLFFSAKFEAKFTVPQTIVL